MTYLDFFLYLMRFCGFKESTTSIRHPNGYQYCKRPILSLAKRYWFFYYLILFAIQLSKVDGLFPYLLIKSIKPSHYKWKSFFFYIDLQCSIKFSHSVLIYIFFKRFLLIHHIVLILIFFHYSTGASNPLYTVWHIYINSI